jgi:hypothetical protein
VLAGASQDSQPPSCGWMVHAKRGNHHHPRVPVALSGCMGCDTAFCVSAHTPFSACLTHPTSDLRTALAEDDAEVEEVMAALGEDRVMNLTEPEVHEVSA